MSECERGQSQTGVDLRSSWRRRGYLHARCIGYMVSIRESANVYYNDYLGKKVVNRKRSLRVLPIPRVAQTRRQRFKAPLVVSPVGYRPICDLEVVENHVEFGSVLFVYVETIDSADKHIGCLSCNFGSNGHLGDFFAEGGLSFPLTLAFGGNIGSRGHPCRK